MLPTIFRKAINFSLGINAIAEIRNTLLNLDWVIQEETDTEILVKSQKGCYLSIQVDFSTSYVVIKGDVAGDKAKLSSALTLSYTEESLNQLWLTANKEAIALTIKEGANNSYQGLWAGHLKDSDRWGLGYIKDDLNSIYLLKNDGWRILSSSFTYSFDSFSSFPTTTSDRLTVAATPVRYYDFEDNRNSAYKAYEGSVNGATNKPLLDFYALIEGKNSAIAYGTSDGEGNAPTLNYLGVVQFICTGMASLNAGAIVTLPSNAEYMSCGGKSWQGMRIS